MYNAGLFLAAVRPSEISGDGGVVWTTRTTRGERFR